MPAEEVTDALGLVDAVVMGQSFHWMARDQVLTQLAPMIRDSGGIALIAPSMAMRAETTDEIVAAMLERYGVKHESLPRPDREPANEPALRRSAYFSDFHSRVFITAFERDIASVIGHIYSMSFSPRSKFGDRIADFERDLTAALLAANPSGVFKERLETEVQIVPKR